MGLIDGLTSLIKRSNSDPPSGSSEFDTDDDPDKPSPEPKTPREHILRLLVQNDGRMTKSALLNEMSVSEVKLNRVLNEMKEEDEVRVVSHRTTKLVCRPGYEPPPHRTI